jgi:hypothetical protein
MLEPIFNQFETGYAIETTFRTFDEFLSAMESGMVTADGTSLSALIMDWVLPKEIVEKIKAAVESVF